MSLTTLPLELREQVFEYLEPKEISYLCRALCHEFLAWTYGIYTCHAYSRTMEREADTIEGWLGPRRTGLSERLDGCSSIAINHIRKLRIAGSPSEILWLFAPDDCTRLLSIPLGYYPHWQNLRTKLRAMRLNSLEINYDPTMCCPRPSECHGAYFDLENAVDDRWVWKAVYETMGPNCHLLIKNAEEPDIVTTHYSQKEIDFVVSDACSWKLLHSSTLAFQRHVCYHLAKDPHSNEERKHFWRVPIRMRDLYGTSDAIKQESRQSHVESRKH